MLIADIVGDPVEIPVAERGHAVSARPTQRVPASEGATVDAVRASSFQLLEHAGELGLDVQPSEQMEVGADDSQFEDSRTMSDRDEGQLFPEPAGRGVIDDRCPIPRRPNDVHEDAMMHPARCPAMTAAQVPPQRMGARIHAPISTTPRSRCRVSDVHLAAALAAACPTTHPSRVIPAPHRSRAIPAAPISRVVA